MVVGLDGNAVEPRVRALDALARVSSLTAAGASLPEVVAAVADGAAAAAGAELVLVRVLEDGGAATLRARGLAPRDSALAAELEGSRIAVADAPTDVVRDGAGLPRAAWRAAERALATASLFVPALVGDRVVGTVELYRAGDPFDDGDVALARLAAAQLAVAVDGAAGERRRADNGSGGTLEIAGEALAAGADEVRAAQEIVRVAVQATGASAAALWLTSALESSDASADGAGSACRRSRA